MAMVLGFDMTLIGTYTQQELSQFVTDQNLDGSVVGRRTKQNLIDALRIHHSTIVPIAVPQVFDIDALNAYTKLQLQGFCTQFHCVPLGTNLTKDDYRASLQEYHDNLVVPTNPRLTVPPGITLNSMFDNMDSTASDDDDLWRASHTAIDNQRSAAKIPTPFRDLISTSRGDIHENSFLLLLHGSGDISIYYADSDNRLIRRTADLGNDTPDVVSLDQFTMTWVLAQVAVERFKRLTHAVSGGFKFDSEIRETQKRKRKNESSDDDDDDDDAKFIGSSKAHHLLAFTTAINHSNSSTSKHLTARGQHMSETAARSFTKSHDRLLTTGASVLFQKLQFPPIASTIPIRWHGADWNRSMPFLIQLQCGHILKLFSSWESVPLEYFADLLGKHHIFQAREISTKIAQSINTAFDIDTTIVLETIVGNDIKQFEKALMNFGYVLDTVYEFRETIAEAIHDMFKRVLKYLQNRTLGPHNDGTSVVFKIAMYQIQKCMQEINSTVLANNERIPASTIASALENAPDLSPDGEFCQQLYLTRMQYQPTLNFLSAPSPLTSNTGVTAGQQTRSKVRRDKRKAAALTGGVTVVSAAPSARTKITTPTTMAATPATTSGTTGKSNICGWYLANKCTTAGCSRGHHPPIAPIDVASAAEFFSSRLSVKQVIF